MSSSFMVEGKKGSAGSSSEVEGTMPELSTNTDLSKLFKTAEELHEPEESIVQGDLPEWVTQIRGSFLRVGPGKFDFENNFTMNHWLDGFAILSKFEIDGPRIKFQKKYLQSDAYQKAITAQKPLITEFATKAYANPANKNFLSRFISSLVPFEMTDNAGTNLFQLSPTECFATSNTTFFRKIDPSNLCTGEKFDYHKCFGLNGVSVHPLTDTNGDIFNIGFSIGLNLTYNVIRIRGNEKYATPHDMTHSSKTLCTIPSRWSTSVGFFHSFGLSANYIIFIEQPYAISLSQAAKALIKGNAFKDWLEWKPNERCRFFLIEKKTGKVIKTEYVSAEAFFFLHIVNCYEQNNQIVIDLNAYASPAVLESLYLKKLRSGESSEMTEVDPSSVQRFILPLIKPAAFVSLPEGTNLIKFQKSASAAIRKGSQIILSPEILTEPGLELPVINQEYLSRRNSYFYATGTIARNFFTNAICKVNTESKETFLWRDSPTHYPGEVIFIPRPGGTAEDDGILISACSNTEAGSKDFLLFVDATSMREIGRAEFEAEIPQSMHGLFLKSH